MSGLFHRLARDRRGVSAIEFAFIAPIMIACYFAVAELSGAMLAERKASLIASEVGDLVAQAATISASDQTDIFYSRQPPSPHALTAAFNMRVTEIGAESSTGKIFTIAWTQFAGNAGAS